jgi:hypothetical protein
MEIICVPAIITLTYIIIEMYKSWVAKGRTEYLSFIPLISLVVGGILGVGIFYGVPQIVIADNIAMAIIVGMCSGLSATGTNQVFKQLGKLGIVVKEETEKKDDDKQINV